MVPARSLASMAAIACRLAPIRAANAADDIPKASRIAGTQDPSLGGRIAATSTLVNLASNARRAARAVSNVMMHLALRGHHVKVHVDTSTPLACVPPTAPLNVTRDAEAEGLPARRRRSPRRRWLR